jgi:hypothetical protein
MKCDQRFPARVREDNSCVVCVRNELPANVTETTQHRGPERIRSIDGVEDAEFNCPRTRHRGLHENVSYLDIRRLILKRECEMYD